MDAMNLYVEIVNTKTLSLPSPRGMDTRIKVIATQGFLLGDAMGMPEGLCQCGCNQKTKIIEYNNKRDGWVKGESQKFIYGHRSRLPRDTLNYPRGHKHGSWKDGEINENGYVRIFLPQHPRNSGNYIPKHVYLAEKAIGKYLPPKALVHHFNGIGDDNSPGNLIACEDEKYHKLLHQRSNSLKATGNVNWRKCVFCKKYDDPRNLSMKNKLICHPKCRAQYQNKRYQKLKHRAGVGFAQVETAK